MILSNVNIGTGPSVGDGDPLRTAFNTINNNFAKIQSNVNQLNDGVTTVSGRTGNVVLTTLDIVGINNYSTVTYVNSAFANISLTSNVASIQANVALLQSDVNTLFGNAGVQSGTLAQLTSNAAVQAGNLATLTANAASQAGELATLLGNAATQASEISSLLANAGSQHEAITSLQSNAAVQAGLIAGLQANIGAGSYGDSNVASYLSGYGGNITVGNIIFEEQGQITGNLIPGANVTYSLGDSTHQWKDLWVSNNTIYLNGIPLGVDGSGNLLVNGAPVSAGTATGITSASTISITNDNSSGDINILSGDDITLQGKNKTISDSEGGDITINAGNGGDADAEDAAGSGGDITIRAGQGGIPSAAYNGGFGGTLDLYGGTGGDSDPGNNRSARDGGRARLQAGSAGSNNGNIALGAEGGTVEITAGQTTLTDTNGGPVIITSGQAGANALAGYVEINIPGSDIGPGGSWYFTGTGRTLEAPQDGEIFQPNAGNLTVASAGNVFVRSYDGDQHEWQFGHNGDLTIPGNITMGPGSGRLISVVTPAPGIVNWEFGMDGNLTVPGNINHANGVNILSGLGSADFSNVSLIGTPGNLTIQSPAANITTTVAHEGGGAGYGVNTISGGASNSPGFVLIQPGWTVTGNNLVGTTTVISKTIDGYGTYSITTDTTEVDPFWFNDVYTFTSNVPSYSNLVISSGNIVSGNSQVNFVANSSGDGQGYSTIELVPDVDRYNSSQYLIVDPTAPGHIHIRAGGTQDNSSADLFLGGENSYVKLPAGLNPNVQIASNTHVWNFNSTGSYGELVLPAGEGLIRTNDDTVSLVSFNTSTGFANTVYLGSGGGVGFFDSAIGGNWLEIFRSGAIPEITSPTGNLKITTVTPGVSSNTWTFGTNGSITFPDTTVQTTAYTGSGSYGNTEVATYLSAYNGSITFTASPAIISGLGIISTVTANVSGNVNASNVNANNSVHFGTGRARITTDDNTSILLTPDTAANALAGVKIGGNGYLLGPNGSRNITLNYGGASGAVGLQANVTVGTASSSILTVNGNVTANNVSTTGTILANGTSGKIGYSSGGYVVQSGNTSSITLHTISGNIQLDSVSIPSNTTHSVALTNNKLDANDIILVQGQDSSAVDLHIGAYYIATNTAFIYLRNISGSSIGPISPMLKFIIVKAPGN